MCAGGGEGGQKSIRSLIDPHHSLKETTMKLSHIAVAASLSMLALTQVHAEQYQGVLQFHSAASRADVNAQATVAAHSPNPYREGASSGVAPVFVSQVDRAGVRAEAVAVARAGNIYGEGAFAGGTTTAYNLAKLAAIREARAESSNPLR
jgi:hypothetical protein